MGEVYRARDTRIDRVVALKVLPTRVATDPAARERFDREARAVSQLDHPNICALHDLGTHEGTNFLVMQYVEGETLAARVERGPIPVDEALDIARQIADALQAAHERGLVHRDLKPANVMQTSDGSVKVLDFGLAKALGDADHSADDHRRANSPTLLSATQAGFILGTAEYMSPEQARGKTVDTRADIWALGSVLYELLTAKRVFDGETITDVLSAVISKEPDWTALPAATPPAIRKLLRRCLTKDLRERLQAAGDARVELEEALDGREEDQSSLSARVATPPQRLWLRPLIFAAISAAAATLATLALSQSRSPATAAPLLRYTLFLPAGTEFGGSGLALSRDGQRVAIALRDQTGQRVWVRALDGSAFQPVVGTDGATNTFWSYEGSDLGFLVQTKLMRVSAAGGMPRDIADLSSVQGLGLIRTTSFDWGPDGTILFGSSAGIYRVAAAGGTPSLLTKVDGAAGEDRHIAPRWLPGGTRFFYTTGSGVATGRLMLQNLAGGQPTRLLEAYGFAYPVRDLLLLNRPTRDGLAVATLSAHAFDAAAGSVGEIGTPIATNIAPDFAASENGIVVYRLSGIAADHRFEWVDAAGRRIGEGFDTTGANSFNLSRDERLVAYAESGDILVRDFDRGVTTRVVQGPALAEPILSPDGSRLAYSIMAGDQIGVAVRPTAGGPAEMVVTSSSVTLVEDWSSDGRFLATINLGGRLGIVSLEGERKTTPFPDLDRISVDEPRFSPDGKWMTFNTTGEGRPEVWLIPIPPTGERWQLSAAGGAQGRWRRDGTAIYYLSPTGELMIVDIKTTPGKPPTIGRPRALFNTGLVLATIIDQYAPSADGSRFLLRRPAATAGASDLHVIVNWPRLLSEGSASSPR
jgi:eukaryotic-like serine/threonine-protein kinase